MHIRSAVLADVSEAADLLHDSILLLCHADHLDDPDTLGRWQRMARPEEIAAWLARADLCALVGVMDGAIISVGAIDRSGRVLANYVSPRAQFRGVSRAMLKALEAQALAWGLGQVVVASTATARWFHRSHGFTLVGLVEDDRGSTGRWEMMKTLKNGETTSHG